MYCLPLNGADCSLGLKVWRSWPPCPWVFQTPRVHPTKAAFFRRTFSHDQKWPCRCLQEGQGLGTPRHLSRQLQWRHYSLFRYYHLAEIFTLCLLNKRHAASVETANFRGHNSVISLTILQKVGAEVTKHMKSLYVIFIMVDKSSSSYHWIVLLDFHSSNSVFCWIPQSSTSL